MHNNTRKTIVAVYDNHQEARDAVQALHTAGFAKDEISLVAGDRGGSTGHHAGGHGDHDHGNKAGQGAVTGGVLGGIAGLVLGLAGMTIPGIGPVIAAGPISTALGGAAAGALAGGIIGGLIGMGIPEEEAHLYAEGVRRGSTIVGVTVPDARVDEAMAILDRFNPIDIDERAAGWKKEGWSRFDENAQPLTHTHTDTTHTATTTQKMPAANLNTNVKDQTLNAGQEAVIPVTQEELVVGKRDVTSGKVRVRSYVMTQPVTETVTLREEHVNVERRPVTGAASTAVGTQVGDAFQERSIVLDEHTEQAVVGKQAHVVEEVVVGKEVNQRTETITDEVRRMDVEVTRDDQTVTGKTTRKR